MISWCKVLRALLVKELRLELRGREFITLLACNSIMIALLVGAGVSSAVLDSVTTQKIFPMLLWITFLLSASVAVARASESELEGRGFEGLLLAGVSGAQMYLAKVIVTAFVFLVDFVLLSVVLAASLDQPLLRQPTELIVIGVGSSVALAALVVLLVGIAGTSKLRGALVPILALPLLFPLFFAGVEMTTQVVIRGSLDLGGIWPSILICANALYLLVGINLFEVAIRD